jgi:arylsulfatase
MLRPLGYRSYHSGKWHVDGRPLQNGFDRSYDLADPNRYFSPRNHLEDDQPLPPVAPADGYYATTAIAEHALRCLRDHAEKFSDKPFFHYLCFTAPHFPLQAPADDIARHREKYHRGWEVVRNDRWQRMRNLGIVDCRLSGLERDVGPPYHFPDALATLGPGETNRPLPWDELSDQQRQFQAVKVSINAAMVDRMGSEIGRVLEQLRSMRVVDNTRSCLLRQRANAEIMVRGDGHDPRRHPARRQRISAWARFVAANTPSAATRPGCNGRHFDAVDRPLAERNQHAATAPRSGAPDRRRADGPGDGRWKTIGIFGGDAGSTSARKESCAGLCDGRCG